ncbi:MAG TPA: hypothetical protein VKL99_05795 [Candidatus Angelobacter sp.]|nr:hypothetical protein [Candidatus Angelobacter sp.]
MSQPLCSRGAELFAAAAHADEEFKSKLIRFFSTKKGDDQELQKIESLGARHRNLDEVFHRHKRFCETCSRTPVTVLRYAQAE